MSVKVHVVSPFALACIVKHHPCFRGSAVIEDVSCLIVTFATLSLYHDIVMHLLPTFKAWKNVTEFHPPAHMESNLSIGTPVCEYLNYYDRIFSRDRHSVGVTFATLLQESVWCGVDWMFEKGTVVVWTETRKAYIFESNDFAAGWKVKKVLNRQDDPFRTWRKHLGGEAIIAREGCWRTAERIFRDHVVPYFASHPHARDATQMCRLRDDHFIWELVRWVSYDAVSMHDKRRTAWVRA